MLGLLALPYQPALIQCMCGAMNATELPSCHAASSSCKAPAGVHVVGGSITRGEGAKHAHYSYAFRFFNAINASFPHRCRALYALALQLHKGVIVSCLEVGFTRLPC